MMRQERHSGKLGARQAAHYHSTPQHQTEDASHCHRPRKKDKRTVMTRREETNSFMNNTMFDLGKRRTSW